MYTTLRAYDEYFAKNIVVPVNKVEVFDPIIRCGGSMSGVEVVVVAESDVTITGGKALTLSFTHSNDGKTFTDVDTIATHKCPLGANVFKPEDIIVRATLPMNCKQYVKCSLKTDDAAPVGNISVTTGYLPR